MIFTSQNSDIKGLANNFQILGNSIRQISRDLSKGAGLSSFTQKVDIDALRDFNAELRSGKSYVEAYKSTVANSNTVTRQQAVAYAKSGQTLSSFTANLQKTTAASKAGEIALKGLAMAGNMLAFWAITKGIELAVNALDNFINRAENAREALDESSSSFSTATSELEDLQSQLDETRQKMDELEEGGITLVEEGQYEELVKTNDELERTISLKKIAQGIQANRAASDAEDLYKALTRFGGDASQERIDEILGSNHESMRVLRDDKLDKDDLNELLAGYTLLGNQITEVQDKMVQYDGDTSKRAQNKIQDLQSDLSKLQDKQNDYTSLISENMSNYQQIYDTLSAYQDAGFILTPNQEQILENASAALDLIDASLGNIYKSYEDLDELDKRSRIAEKLQSSGLTENQSNRLANSLSEEELSYAGQINFDEVDSIQSFNNALDKVKREANKSDNAVVVNVEPTISSSVSQIATQLKPQFDELAEAYKEIFSDDGFSIDVVDNEMLENLRSAFEDIEEDVGVSFDTTELNKFFSVLTDGASTADEVQQAFNDLATAYLYSTDTMENLNDETAAAIEQQLQEMGVTNSNEVVTAALAQKKAELAAENLYAAQTGGTLANATAAEIAAFAAEQVQLGNTNQAMYQVLMQKAQFNLTSINTAADIDNLYQLAQAAGATAQTLDALNAAKGRFGSTDSSKLDALRARKDAQRALKSQSQQADFGFGPVEIDFDGAYDDAKKDAGKAGKEAADEYLEKFEKELSSLKDLHERGKLSEKDFLDALRALYQKYFRDKEKYLDEYQKYENEYLQGMKDLYESVMSGIISRIDDHIDKLNDQKDAALDAIKKERDAVIDGLEKQKEAAEEAYEAEQKAAIKALEEEQKAREKALQAEWDAKKEALENDKQDLQNQMDDLQSQIDLRNEEIDAINEAAAAEQRKANLEDAIYNKKRAQEQRVNKVYSGQDRGFIYEADTTSIREADQAIEDAQREIRIANIQEEVKALEERRDALADQQDQIEDQIDKLDEYYDKLIDESNTYYDELIDATNERYENLIANSNAYYDGLIESNTAYYDNLISSTEAAWDKIIEGFELTKSRWEELQELEEQAQFEANLRQLGLTIDDVLNMSEADFEDFKNSYLGIMSDIYSGNDQMIASMSELANVDLSALPGYLEQTQQYIDMLNEGINFEALNESLSGTITGIEDAAKAAGVFTGAILGGGSSGGSGTGESESGNSENSGGSGVVPALTRAGEVGVEQGAAIAEAFAGEEESATASINTATQSIVGGSDSGGSGGNNKKSKSGSSDEEGTDGLIPAFTQAGEVGVEQAGLLTEAYGGEEESVTTGVNTATESLVGGENNKEGSFVEANKLATEAALDESKGIPAQIDKWAELDGVLRDIISHLDDIRAKLEKLSTMEVSIPSVGSVGYSHFEGTVNKSGNSYDSGTTRNQGIPTRERNALVSEFGPEIAVYPNGTYKLFREPSIVDLPQGTAIFNTKQTLDILKGEKNISLGSAHFAGYNDEILERMRNIVSTHTLDNFDLGTLGDYEVAGSNNSNTVVNLNGGIVLEGVQDVDALAKGIVQKLPLKMMQIMNRKEYRPRR